MPNKHAVLSASSSHRWISCPPSAKLCAAAGDRPSPYAQQGTDAHSLCEFKILTALGRECTDPTESLTFFDREMDTCTDAYCNYVMGQYEDAKRHCPDPLILIEQRLDFSRWVPFGFGTGDCVIVADNVLHVIDFKYGLGILVDAEDNPQMRCYALGALDAYDSIYDISTIKMTIFQPRRDNTSTSEMGREELLSWADAVLSPAARLAHEGSGEFHAGEHCRFCSAKSSCLEHAEYSSRLAAYDFMAQGTGDRPGHSTANVDFTE